MKTLIEAVEAWIDDRVANNIAVERADRMSHSAFVDVEELNGTLKAMEDIHIRDANRISELESKLRTQFQDIDTLNMQVSNLTGRLDDGWLRVGGVNDRLDDVNGLLDEAVYRNDLSDMIENVVSEVDLESRIIDAVKEEIDAIDFKITVER